MNKKFYKLCSIVLTLAIVLSTCICAIGTISATEATNNDAPQNVTYYVKNGATGDGKTAETPAPNFSTVIDTINTDKLGANDVATVLIMKRDDFNYQTEGYHNMAYWCETSAKPAAHTAKLVVKPYDTSKETYLVYSNLLGKNSELILGGPTVFENLILVCPRYAESVVASYGNNLTLGSGTAFGWYGSWNIPANTEAATFTVGKRNSSGVATDCYNNNYSHTANDSVTINFENVYKSSDNDIKGAFRIGSPASASSTYEKDINVIMNNSSIDTDIYFGNSHATSGTTTIKGNININVKKATKIELQNTRDDGSVLRPVTANAVQVIVSAGEFKGKAEDFTNVTLAKGAYYINNLTGNSDLIDFTETAGKYKVNLDLQYQDIKLVKADDESVVATPDSEGYITVAEPGEYTFKASKVATYYVKPDADSSVATGEYDKPFRYINEAIKAAYNAKYGACDIVNLKLIKATATAEDETVSEVKHFWFFDEYTKDSVNKSQAHNFKLNISSASATDKVTIHTDVNIGLGGPTEFENVILSFASGKRFILHNNDTSFGKDVEYVGTADFYTSWGKDIKESVDYYFESSPANLRIGGRWSGTYTFKNVNVTINDAAFSRAFIIGDAGGGNYNHFEGILNFNVKNAASISFTNANYYALDGFAAQVINSTGVEAISSNASTYFSGKKLYTYDTVNNTYTEIANVVPYYVINNITKDKDLIGFTSTAGTYSINGLDEDEVLCVYNEVTKEVIKTDAETFTVGVGEYSVWVENDTNADIDVDIRDLVYASENTNATDANIIKRADIDGNGAVDAEDVKALYKILLGIIA